MTQLLTDGVHRLLMTACVFAVALLGDDCDRKTAAHRRVGPGVVVIDAGHGGKDPGTLGGDTPTAPEKEITLAISTRIATLLSERGVNVIQTREDDVFIELDDRAAVADRHQVDLFVSIHADAAGSPDASGATLYVRPGSAGPSRRAARAIESVFETAAIKCRGITTADFRVLVGHTRPAVLVECGYLTNENDTLLLNDESFQDTIAAAIADGIEQFLKP